jgi:hypothetical protein
MPVVHQVGVQWQTENVEVELMRSMLLMCRRLMPLSFCRGSITNTTTTFPIRVFNVVMGFSVVLCSCVPLSMQLLLEAGGRFFASARQDAAIQDAEASRNGVMAGGGGMASRSTPDFSAPLLGPDQESVSLVPDLALGGVALGVAGFKLLRLTVICLPITPRIDC